MRHLGNAVECVAELIGYQSSLSISSELVLAEARFKICWTPSRGSTAKQLRLLFGKVP